jgi:hypothetical protein
MALIAHLGNLRNERRYMEMLAMHTCRRISLPPKERVCPSTLQPF